VKRSTWRMRLLSAISGGLRRIAVTLVRLAQRTDRKVMEMRRPRLILNPHDDGEDAA